LYHLDYSIGRDLSAVGGGGEVVCVKIGGEKLKIYF
jgi:hypothetical protein